MVTGVQEEAFQVAEAKIKALEMTLDLSLSHKLTLVGNESQDIPP